MPLRRMRKDSLTGAPELVSRLMVPVQSGFTEYVPATVPDTTTPPMFAVYLPVMFPAPSMKSIYLSALYPNPPGTTLCESE